MPSAHGQNRFIMDKQTAVNTVSPAQMGAEAIAFICTECGDGFSQYTNVLTHMAIHGPLESFSFDGSSNGFEIPREYVLQENGTLIIVNGLAQLNSFNSSNSSATPRSPERVSSHLPSPIKPVSTILNSQPSSYKDTFRPRPPGLNSDQSRQNCYHCEICNRSFTTPQNLLRHQQYGNSERGFRCTLCCQIFDDKHNFKKHLQDHFNERISCCGHCGKRFLKIDALNAHQKENHSMPKGLGKPESKEDKKMEKAYPCNKCKLVFFWMSDLQIHSLYHCKGQEPDVELESDFEIDEFSKDSEDEELVNCHTNGPSSDVKNGSQKISRDDDDEKNKQPTFTPYRCGLCGDRFEKLADLKEHHVTHQTQEEIDELNQEHQRPLKRVVPPNRRRRSNPNGKLHPCKHCHRVFNHSSSLSRHMRYHKGTMHTCVFCGRHFPQRCDLRRHVIMYHKTEGLKLLNSNSQNGPSSNLVDDEKQANTPEDNTKESLGNKQTSGELSEKFVRANYKCLECGKKFGLLCVYQRHLRYHKKEPTKCPKCPAEFKNSVSLEVHLKNHSGSEQAGDDGDGQKSPAKGNGVDKALKDNPEDIEEDDMDQKQNEKGSFSEALYECTECTDTFSCLDTFLQHQASHGSETKAN
uniref:Zinc finger protein 160-like n=1 Tax=Fundulus heteroclitus TaxID=8078 RepID=A0A3Q2QBG6_FUNHE